MPGAPPTYDETVLPRINDTWKILPADKALEWGLVNRVLPDDELESSCLAFAQKIAAYSPAVLGLGKRLFYEQADLSLEGAYGLTAEGMACNMMFNDAAEGIDAEVIDLRTLRPLDKETVLASLAKTNRMVVAEEGFPVCSIASEIIAICMTEGFDHLDAPVLRVCNEDVPQPYAANLERLSVPRAPEIVAGVRAALGR
mgnify:CR=1 FL=1